MKIIIHDRLNRPTEPDKLFIFYVPEREGKIIVEALNLHALGYDSFECVEDDYKLYRPHECTKEYFIALSDIWRKWFAARKGGEPFTMLQRDKEIAWLQRTWKPGQARTVAQAPVAHNPAPKIILKLAR